MEQLQAKNLAITLLSVGLIGAVIPLIILIQKSKSHNEGLENFTTLSLDSISFTNSIYNLAPQLGSVPENQARSNIFAYREINKDTSGYGIYYDSSDISYYATEIFPKLVKAEISYMSNTQHPYDPATQKWQIGIYWMINNDGQHKKYDCCFVPILVDRSNPKNILEYFIVGDTKYDHNPTILLRRRAPGPLALTDSSSTGSIFNTGTMFP